MNYQTKYSLKKTRKEKEKKMLDVWKICAKKKSETIFTENVNR